MSDKLEDIAKAMVQPGQGILAADESTGTIKKRFDSIQVDSTEDNRRDYREMLFRADDAMTNHISGVILFDETIRQKAKDGTPLVTDMFHADRWDYVYSYQPGGGERVQERLVVFFEDGALVRFDGDFTQSAGKEQFGQPQQVSNTTSSANQQ